MEECNTASFTEFIPALQGLSNRLDEPAFTNRRIRKQKAQGK